MAASKIGDLEPALDLIAQPLLLEALIALDSGKALEDALPADTDPVILDAAICRLAAVGAVEPSSVGPFGPHTLTARGRHLMRLLERLDSLLSDLDSAPSIG